MGLRSVDGDAPGLGVAQHLGDLGVVDHPHAEGAGAAGSPHPPVGRAQREDRRGTVGGEHCGPVCGHDRRDGHRDLVRDLWHLTRSSE